MKFYVFLLMLISLLACENQENNDQEEQYWETVSYNSEGEIVQKFTLNLDSQFVNGQFYYYDNGFLSKWIWYDKPGEYPLFGIYFNEKQEFERTEGIPFIGVHKTFDDFTAVELVNPPGVNTIAGYKDFYEKELKFKIGYEPGKTDTTQWITLKHYNYDSTHNYYVYFHVLDDSGKIVTTDSIEILP